jgi:hypothetical protein
VANDEGKRRKPLIFPGQEVTNTSERWEASQQGKTAYKVEPPEGGWDANYVPGYSDERHSWEAKKEVAVLHMPARLQWVRCTGQEPDYRDWMEWARNGYVLLKADAETRTCADLSKHGWDIPSAAVIQPNGLIRKGTDDAVLAYCPKDQAIKNWKAEREYTAFLEGTEGKQGVKTGVPLESEEETREQVKLGDQDVDFK